MRATRIVASALGIYGGFLGTVHGYYEVLQGSIVPNGIAIHAVGGGCQPETVSHACLPAMTLIPNFQTSGVVAILVSIIVLVWAAVFIERKHGSLILFLLSILMLLVGGGFIPPFYAMIAAAVGTQLHTPLAWWKRQLSSGMRHLLAASWLWLFLVYLLWTLVAQLIFGEALNDFLLRIGVVLMPIQVVFLLLTVVAAFAHDIQQETSSVQLRPRHM